MARGTPDFAVNPYQLATPSVDLSAVYQGLTGMIPLDAKGRIFFNDTFHQGLGGWVNTLTGNATAAAINFNQGYVQGCCVKLPCGTVAGAGKNLLERGLVLPNVRKAGIEAALLIDLTMKVYYRISLLFCYAAGLSYNAYLYYEVPTGNISISTTLGNIIIGSIPITTQVFSWLPLKLVIDPNTGYYVRVIIGTLEIDLRQYLISTGVLDIKGTYYYGIRTQAADNVAGRYGSFGYVLCTTDEP